MHKPLTPPLDVFFSFHLQLPFALPLLSAPLIPSHVSRASDLTGSGTRVLTEQVAVGTCTCTLHIAHLYQQVPFFTVLFHFLLVLVLSRLAGEGGYPSKEEGKRGEGGGFLLHVTCT